MEEQAREQLITEAVAEFEAGLRAKADQFHATYAERKLTISVIERLWGETQRKRRQRVGAVSETVG